MTASRSRKIIFVILTVAVAALVVDRLVLAPSATGPKQAGAATPGVPEASETSPSPSPGAEAPAETSSGPRLAERLQTVADRFELDPTALRDGFVPSETWLEDLVEAPPPSEPKTAPNPHAAADAFAENHTLTSVIMTSQGGSAVVDGKVVPVGRTIDGFRLVRLTRRTAVFEADGEEVELSLRR